MFVCAHLCIHTHRASVWRSDDSSGKQVFFYLLGSGDQTQVIRLVKHRYPLSHLIVLASHLCKKRQRWNDSH